MRPCPGSRSVESACISRELCHHIPAGTHGRHGSILFLVTSGMVERRALLGRVGCDVASQLAIRRARCSPPHELRAGTYLLDVDGRGNDAAICNRCRPADRGPQPVGEAASCDGGIPHRFFCALAAVGHCCRWSAGTILDALVRCACARFFGRRTVATDVNSQAGFQRMLSYPALGASRLAGGSRLCAVWRNHRRRLCQELLAIDAGLRVHRT